MTINELTENIKLLNVVSGAVGSQINAISNREAYATVAGYSVPEPTVDIRNRLIEISTKINDALDDLQKRSLSYD